MEKIHVLLVEDEQTLAMIIKDTLEEQDFIITTAGDGDAAAAAAAVDAVAAGAVIAVTAVAALGVDRTAGDGEAVAVDAAAAAICAAATLGRQTVLFAAGDGEAAVAGDAAEAIAAVVADTTGERVVALQGQCHVAFRSEGGTGAGLDVHILKCDLGLIVLIFGLDGHGVGRSGVRFLICDDGVGVIFGGHIVLGDVVAGVARFHGDVTILDAPCLRKGRGSKGGEHYGSQDKRCCPLRGRTG